MKKPGLIMTNLLKYASILFIFIFLTSNVFAAVEILDVGSDAKEKGFLGIGDSISFYIKFSEPVASPKIYPEKYNSRELVWSADDEFLVYTAKYVINEGDDSQEMPLQLEEVKVILEDGMELSKDGSEIVFKSIDAKRPSFDYIIINPININNVKIYPIRFLLNEKEKDGFLEYEIKIGSKKIAGNVDFLNHYEECFADPELLSRNCPITIFEDLSSLTDGSVVFDLVVFDRAKNKLSYSTDVIKDVIRPEVDLIDAENINLNNYKKYFLKIKVNKEYKNLKLIFEDSKDNVLSFETLTDIDLSGLEDGPVLAKLIVYDSVGNDSKEQRIALKKDLVAPELQLDNEMIYSNISDVNITGKIIDGVTEKINVKYSILKSSGLVSADSKATDSAIVETQLKDCEIRESGSSIGKYNYITCNINKLKDGEHKILIVASDSSKNITEKVVLVNINTSSVYFDLDGGQRIVKNTTPETINGKVVMNSDADTRMFAILRSLTPGSINYKTYAIKVIDGKFKINLAEPISGTYPVVPLLEGDYLLSVRLSDIYGNAILKTQKIIIDNTKPVIEINALSTTDRTPILTGKVRDKTMATIIVSVNGVDYNATVDGENWSAQINNNLPLGTLSVKVLAEDEAKNKNEIDDEIIINSTGGGTRIYPAVNEAAEDTPVIEPEVQSSPEPVIENPVQSSQESNSNTNTGGLLTQEQETPIEETLENISEPSGLTGFAGFVSKPGGIVTVILSIFSVVGVLGYLFVFKKR